METKKFIVVWLKNSNATACALHSNKRFYSGFNFCRAVATPRTMQSTRNRTKTNKVITKKLKIMYYTATTTAAQVWVTTSTEFATISTEAAPAAARKSFAARLWATVKDYAAGTLDGIKTRTAKAAAKVGRKIATAADFAALLLVRVLFMAVSLSSGLAVMFGAALVIPEITPDGFAACLLLRVPALFAAVGLWAFVWCWSLRHILPARLFDYIQYGNR